MNSNRDILHLDIQNLVISVRHSFSDDEEYEQFDEGVEHCIIQHTTKDTHQSKLATEPKAKAWQRIFIEPKDKFEMLEVPKFHSSPQIAHHPWR